MPVNALHRAVREPTSAAVLAGIYAALAAGDDVNAHTAALGGGEPFGGGGDGRGAGAGGGG